MSDRRSPCRLRVISLKPASGNVSSNSTFRAKSVPEEPISGLRMSLQMPVSVRPLINAPGQI